MTTSLANVTLDPGNWIDLCALYPAIAGGDVVLRYLSPFAARLVHGGAGAPATLEDGDRLMPGEAVYASSDHIWVAGQGTISVTLL